MLILGIAIAVLVVLAAAVVLAPHGATRFTTTAAATPNRSTAHNALGPVGFQVVVENVQRDAIGAELPTPPAGRHDVLVRVRFQNTSDSQQRATPLDFQLRDSAGKVHRPAFTSGAPCQQWPMTGLVPASDQSGNQRDPEAQRAGPAVGPVTLCFQVSGPAQSPLSLIWDHDVSGPFLGAPTEIPPE